MRWRSPIFVGGTIAGILDILAAFALGYPRVRPAVILQSIASGLLGPAAFRGGLPTAVLGLALHVLIATTAAAVYVVASRRWAGLVRRPWVFGPAYGVAVYLVMQFVVLPLSRVNQRSQRWSLIATMVCIHIVCVGLPIALTARALRRHDGRK